MGCNNGKIVAQETVSLAILGLDNAGKTVTAAGLQGLSIDRDFLPTDGVSKGELSYGGQSVILYDLGGGRRNQSQWNKILSDVHGIIFVLDSGDRHRIEEAAEKFEGLLNRDNVSGKPVLLLANKQDKRLALNERDITERLNLDRISRRAKCNTHLELCSAKKGTGTNIDPAITDGFSWLLGEINANWSNLQKRVQNDSGGEYSPSSSPRARSSQFKSRLSDDDDPYDKFGSKRKSPSSTGFKDRQDSDDDVFSRSSSRKTKSSGVFSARVYGNSARRGSDSPEDDPLSTSARGRNRLPPLDSSLGSRKKKSVLSRTGSDDDLTRSTRTGSSLTGKKLGGANIYDISALDDPYDRPSSRKSGGRFGLDDDDEVGKYSSKSKTSSYSSRFKKDDDLTTGSRFSKSPSRFKDTDDTYGSSTKYGGSRWNKDDDYKSSYKYGKTDDYKSKFDKDDDDYYSSKYDKDDDYKSSRFGRTDDYSSGSKYGTKSKWDKDEDYKTTSSKFSSKYGDDDDDKYGTTSRFKKDNNNYGTSKYGKYGGDDDDYKTTRYKSESTYGRSSYKSGSKRSDGESDDDNKGGYKSKWSTSKSKYDEDDDLYGTKSKYGSKTPSFSGVKDSLRLRSDYKGDDSGGSDELKTPRKSRDWSPHASRKWGTTAGSGDSEDSGVEEERNSRRLDKDKYSFGGSSSAGRKLAPIGRSKGTFDTGSRFTKTTSRFDDTTTSRSYSGGASYGTSRYNKDSDDSVEDKYYDYRGSGGSKWGMAEDLQGDDDSKYYRSRYN